MLSPVNMLVNVLKDGETMTVEPPDPSLAHHRSPFIPSSGHPSATLSIGGLIVPITGHDTVCLWDLHEILMSDWIKMARAVLPAVCSM